MLNRYRKRTPGYQMAIKNKRVNWPLCFAKISIALTVLILSFVPGMLLCFAWNKYGDMLAPFISSIFH